MSPLTREGAANPDLRLWCVFVRQRCRHVVSLQLTVPDPQRVGFGKIEMNPAHFGGDRRGGGLALFHFAQTQIVDGCLVRFIHVARQLAPQQKNAEI